MKLTEKSSEVFNYVKENGARVSVEEICKATGRESRSINATVNDLVKKGLVERDKVTVEGADKPVTYVVLTEDGKAFVPSEDAE
jgi:predicted transcriptional regulator